MKQTLLILTLCCAAGVHANFVQNSSFELPNTGNGNASNVSIPGWTSTNNVVEVGHGLNFYGEAAPDGVQVADLGGTFGLSQLPKAKIYQDLVLAPGTYSFSFTYWQRSADGNSSNRIQAIWDEGGANQFSPIGSPGGGWFTSGPFTVMTTSLVTKISFAEIGNPNNPGNGTLLDQVSVVPEPLSLVAMGVGFAWLAVRRRRLSSLGNLE